MPVLTREQIEELRNFDTPTVSNAIERFKIRPRTEGFAGPAIRCLLPCKKPVVGYACTVKISAINPPTAQQMAYVYEFYSKLKETQTPSIAVVQDLDPSPIGSFWGEVNASVTKSLGCVGTVTNGGVRDLDEVMELDFGYFARCVLVSHAYVHIEEYDTPVTIDGLTVIPGDLLHADKHGVLLIPDEIASEVAEACRKTQYAEQPVIDACRKHAYKNVEIDDIRRWRQLMEERRKEN